MLVSAAWAAATAALMLRISTMSGARKRTEASRLERKLIGHDNIVVTSSSIVILPLSAWAPLYDGDAVV